MPTTGRMRRISGPLPLPPPAAPATPVAGGCSSVWGPSSRSNSSKKDSAIPLANDDHARPAQTRLRPGRSGCQSPCRTRRYYHPISHALPVRERFPDAGSRSSDRAPRCSRRGSSATASASTASSASAAPARCSARSTSSARRSWRSRRSRTTRRCGSARGARRPSRASSGTRTSCACAACTRTASTSTSHPTSSRAWTSPARCARGSSATRRSCASPPPSAPGSRTRTSTAWCTATSSPPTSCSAATAPCACSTSASPSLDEPDATVDDRMLGTLSYMAPETCQGARPTPATDVWAVGVMVYEALTGANPFRARTPDELRERHKHPPRSLGDLRPDLPRSLAAACARALESHPRRRPSATALSPRALGGRRRDRAARRPRAAHRWPGRRRPRGDRGGDRGGRRLHLVPALPALPRLPACPRFRRCRARTSSSTSTGWAAAISRCGLAAPSETVVRRAARLAAGSALRRHRDRGRPRRVPVLAAGPRPAAGLCRRRARARLAVARGRVRARGLRPGARRRLGRPGLVRGARGRPVAGRVRARGPPRAAAGARAGARRAVPVAALRACRGQHAHARGPRAGRRGRAVRDRALGSRSARGRPRRHRVRRRRRAWRPERDRSAAAAAERGLGGRERRCCRTRWARPGADCSWASGSPGCWRGRSRCLPWRARHPSRQVVRSWPSGPWLYCWRWAFVRPTATRRPGSRFRRRSKLGILRSIESRLERVVEGSVGRLFRASVAPVELARKLAKELEEGKVVSVTQTYAPNEYTDLPEPARSHALRRVRGLAAQRARELPRRARAARRLRHADAPARALRDGILAPHRDLRHLDGARARRRLRRSSRWMRPAAAAAGAVGAAAALSADAGAPAPTRGPPPSRWPMPEEPVRSPLDPDPSEPGPPGFPVYPLEPERRSLRAERAGGRVGAVVLPTCRTHRRSCPACRCTRTLPVPAGRADPAGAAARPAGDGAAPGCAAGPGARSRRPAAPPVAEPEPEPCRSWRAGSICPSTRRSRRP